MRPFRPQCSSQAFTVLDAIALLALTGAFATLIAPALQHDRELSRRIQCRRNLGQLGVATHLYAEQNNWRLFTRTRVNGDWVGFNLPDSVFSQLTNLAGDRVIDCPNLHPFTMPGQVYERGGRSTAFQGMVIGYIYCGGVQETNMLERYGWTSPATTRDDPTLPLFVDLNGSGWGDGFWVVAPHTRTGPFRLRGATYHTLQAQMTPVDLGAEGGNICSLDGSVRWKPIAQMKRDNWIFKYYTEAKGIW